MRDEELMWFDNPPRKRRGKKRRKLYGAAAAAHAKKVGGHRRKRSTRRKGVRHVAKRRRKLYGAAAAAHARKHGGGRRRSSHRRTSRRKYRRTSVAVARRAGRQLRYRRSNPPFGRGIVGQLMNGAVDATEVVLGKAVARIIPSFANLPQAGAVGLAVQVGSALLAGYLARRISPNASKMVLAGGLAAPIESFIKGMNIPMVSAALGDEGYYAVGAYPMAPAIAAYPQASLSGDEEDVSGGVYGY